MLNFMIFFLVNLQDSIIGWKNLRRKICEIQLTIL